MLGTEEKKWALANDAKEMEKFRKIMRIFSPEFVIFRQ